MLLRLTINHSLLHVGGLILPLIVNVAVSEETREKPIHRQEK